MQFTTKTVCRAVALAFIGAAGAATAQAEDIIKIGHVAATSGPIAHLGKDNENGARMAVDELNAKGVLIGGKKYKVVLLAEDDAGDPKQATSAAQKLVDAKVQGVIGHETSGTAIPASRIYYDAGIPQITPSASSPAYTRQRYNTTFRNIANDEQLGPALARYAMQNMQAKRIAVVDDRTAYGKGLADEFSKTVKRTGAATGSSIVSTQYTNDKATDLTAILTAIKATKPDMIFFGGMDAVAAPMLRQMKQLGFPIKFMGGDGMCSDSVPRLAGEGMSDGQVICAEAGGVEPAQEKGMADFRAAYKKRYGIEVQTYAPYTYDALMTMVEAMQKAGSPDPAKYLPVLAKIKHKGVTGNISFDARGDVQDGVLTIFTFKNGKRQKLAVMK
ncbi:branched-chain amino acid transport system substrate-binding protein [Duganella sp. CF402]|uniref:branched-chain amino acid ABC transporter substrate-binding protein n=1 Tax=unclassified Duganella TaxID=2636909 RepID=UPI0008B6A520|nr:MULTISPECIES: branched-chain amino acid ABC transporter substrate-binding protein [unclassified Duganella]RZT10635.1 amino acid/amide ABC transporter substrate-binding protein (HAAT family) [Duganella sp. BK701]SEL04910.1 branched-chain amino acid transport system substrate-binding protein [Duganella sp. CF402]